MTRRTRSCLALAILALWTVPALAALGVGADVLPGPSPAPPGHGHGHGHGHDHDHDGGHHHGHDVREADPSIDPGAPAPEQPAETLVLELLQALVHGHHHPEEGPGARAPDHEHPVRLASSTELAPPASALPLIPAPAAPLLGAVSVPERGGDARGDRQRPPPPPPAPLFASHCALLL